MLEYSGYCVPINRFGSNAKVVQHVPRFKCERKNGGVFLNYRKTINHFNGCLLPRTWLLYGRLPSICLPDRRITLQQYGIMEYDMFVWLWNHALGNVPFIQRWPRTSSNKKAHFTAQRSVPHSSWITFFLLSAVFYTVQQFHTTCCMLMGQKDLRRLRVR